MTKSEFDNLVENEVFYESNLTYNDVSSDKYPMCDFYDFVEVTYDEEGKEIIFVADSEDKEIKKLELISKYPFFKEV